MDTGKFNIIFLKCPLSHWTRNSGPLGPPGVVKKQVWRSRSEWVYPAGYVHSKEGHREGQSGQNPMFDIGYHVSAVLRTQALQLLEEEAQPSVPEAGG